MQAAGSFTTKRSTLADQGVEIDGVLYPFAARTILPAEDIDFLSLVVTWLHFGYQVSQVMEATQDGAEPAALERPATYPPTQVEFDAALLRAVKLCLPTAPEDKLIAIQRDNQMEVIGLFLQPRRARRSTSPSPLAEPTPLSSRRTSRRSTTAVRANGSR